MITRMPALFSEEEVRLIADRHFFLQKAAIMKKVRTFFNDLHAELRADVETACLLAPPSFDPGKAQFVKGEHLEDYPYQYLDFPKHFEGDEKFTFRSLFWWGHHFVFALIVEGPRMPEYKRNFVNRYHDVAGHDLHLALSPTPWEWKYGEGYTLPLTHNRKSQVAAVLAGRRFFKLARFVRHDDPLIAEGRLIETARAAFRSLLPIITP